MSQPGRIRRRRLVLPRTGVRAATLSVLLLTGIPAVSAAQQDTASDSASTPIVQLPDQPPLQTPGVRTPATFVRADGTEVGIPAGPTVADRLRQPEIVAFGVVGLASSVVAVVLVWTSRRPKKDPADLAFDALARKAGLTRARRAMLRTISTSLPGSAPVALLLSKQAFTDAASAAIAAGTIDKASLAALRDRLGYA